MMNKVYIVAAALNDEPTLVTAILQRRFTLRRLTIDPLSVDWNAPCAPDHFKSGCAPVEALASAKVLIAQGIDAVVIQGQDLLKSGYQRQERQALMAVYGQNYPLTQAYTDLARQFIRYHHSDATLFKQIRDDLFANYLATYRQAMGEGVDQSQLPSEKWYQPLTALFRGVDCANPLVDFSGSLLLCNESVVQQLNIAASDRIELVAVGLGQLAGDVVAYLAQIARYDHLKSAYDQCCYQASVHFAAEFRQNNALLETYTCYPVVPMGFLLASGLVENLAAIPDLLQQYPITVTGGMNLARAPWNNPALNGLIKMVERLLSADQTFGMVHANGGLGYRQGVALLRRC